MFETVLIANRGEAACRVIRTLRKHGIRSIAIASDNDMTARHAREADEVIPLGGEAPADTYLNVAKVIQAARTSGAQAIHPVFGFLAENAAAAKAIRAAGLAFVGPSTEAIAAMADKIRSRILAGRAGLAVSRGSEEPILTVEDAKKAAASIGYPIMIKPSSGGGGIGMVVAKDESELVKAVDSTLKRALRLFGDPALLLEEFVSNARHIEVQVLGLADGTIIPLGERDCTAQRRYQKVAEESPSPAVASDLRRHLIDAAKTFSQALGYQGVGTVEFLVDQVQEKFVFLEMNTRLQVEHPVTELVTGLDLVWEQLLVAAGDDPSFSPADPPTSSGHCIEVRVCAEDPVTFRPAPGRIERWEVPSGVGIRVDDGYAAGDAVSPYYDSLLAKLCAVGADRPEAVERLATAIDAFVIEGPRSNLPFFQKLLRHPAFVDGSYGSDIVTRIVEGSRR
ncbi:acetyl-CoA carboxylase biotin carboxylase subunit [Brevibacterium aurantiacum]|uniref:acetyl-CoA carboxylase biotin carboxylase subunit n=1 Tax=Brevibacterium aurantiacum TaxID=273384 RepID=UPI0018671DA4|nr:biotin carboxylase N-terminal domain-containing protein [Brevibacterium aurantiacum]